MKHLVNEEGGLLKFDCCLLCSVCVLLFSIFEVSVRALRAHRTTVLNL